jgi:hypothetical protein
MDNTDNRNLFESLSWQWILVSYCFLVLFHLFPTCILLSPRTLSLGNLLNIIFAFEGKEFIQLAIWFGIEIATVGAFVGYRSQKQRILEPAIAAAAYCLTIMIHLQPPSDVPAYYSTTGFIAAMCIFSFVIGFAGASFTTLLRLARGAKMSS